MVIAGQMLAVDIGVNDGHTKHDNNEDLDDRWQTLIVKFGVNDENNTISDYDVGLLLGRRWLLNCVNDRYSKHPAADHDDSDRGADVAC